MRVKPIVQAIIWLFLGMLSGAALFWYLSPKLPGLQRQTTILFAHPPAPQASREQAPVPVGEPNAPVT